MAMEYWSVDGYGYDLDEINPDQKMFGAYVQNLFAGLESAGSLGRTVGYRTVDDLLEEYGTFEEYADRFHDEDYNEGSQALVCFLLSLALEAEFGCGVASQFEMMDMYQGQVVLFATSPYRIYPFENADVLSRMTFFDKDEVFGFIEHELVEMGVDPVSLPKADYHHGYSYG